MNTNHLKKFAREARTRLIDLVRRKLEYVLTQDSASLRGKEAQVTQLRQKITDTSSAEICEAVAYTWFNRLMALRFMDANGYTIPKVVTPDEGMSTPAILQNALSGHIEESLKIDRVRLADLLDGRTAVADAHTEAYKMLLIAACNAWHIAMPFMFEPIADYTELLLPDDLLSAYSIVAFIRTGMSDEDCRQEELIGWLYQFYISEKKDAVFEGLKKNIKISAANIPAATQLFTPRWIVRYMVENTLGKIWLTLKPGSSLRAHMPYFIEAPEGAATALPDGIKGITDIRFLDPCVGSGHILVYAFELLTRIYEEEGYPPAEIPALILEHNLWGIDIDARAAQLAAFALTMKARSYYSRFLRKPVQPHVLALKAIHAEALEEAIALPVVVAGKLITKLSDLSLHLLTEADNFGSLIQINREELLAIIQLDGGIWRREMEAIAEQAAYLSNQYHCVVTNPPYMGASGMNDKLYEWTREAYQYSKTDLFSMFIERSLCFTTKSGFLAMVTMQNWMFIESFQSLRQKLISSHFLSSLVQVGYNSFPELNSKVTQACTFVFVKSCAGKVGTYVNLNNAPQSSNKEDVFFQRINAGEVFTKNQDDFKRIPSATIGYWLSENALKQLEKSKPLHDFGNATKGLDTCDNNRFVRYWYEVSLSEFSPVKCFHHKWFIYFKGGEFQKWYGNNDKVVNWEKDGHEIRNFRNLDGSIKSRPQNIDRYFQKGITWSSIGSGLTSYRIMEDGIFGGGGNGFFPPAMKVNNFLGFLNSKVSAYFKDLFNPTLNNLSGDLHKLPIGDFVDNVDLAGIVERCLAIAKKYKGYEEDNIDFSTSPVVQRHTGEPLEVCLSSVSEDWRMDFQDLRENETEINRLLINLYGLQDELVPDVPLEEITILQEEAKIIDGRLEIKAVPVMKQLISYAIGCLFGRYSLDKPGLILPNAGEGLPDYLAQIPSPTFLPNSDNIIPILEGEYFTDDVVTGFKRFLRAAFSEAHYEENLKFIEDTLGKDIRKYFVKDFYADHVKRYKKRPIYWMFSSPKGHFRALIYMHRYTPDLCSKMLNDYLQPFISKLEANKTAAIATSLREDTSAREKSALGKEADKIDVMLKDCREYEQILYSMATQKPELDLDDGVRVNYTRFKSVLVPIKGLEKEEE